MPIPRARIDAALSAAAELEPKLQLVLMETRLLLRTLDSQREDLRLLCGAALNAVRKGRADDASGILSRALSLLL